MFTMSIRSIARTSVFVQIVSVLFLHLLVPGLISTAEAQEDRRPNILVIMSDDHAADAISAYGSKMNRTPGIDRLAREGMRFTNCFVVNSLCKPSRATILTGTYGKISGMINNRSKAFDGSRLTFPKMARESGYETALIGKWHLGSRPTGFDHWDVLPGQGRYFDPVFKTSEGTTKEEGFVTDVITEKSIDWLKQRSGQNPFMLLVQHKAVHAPVEQFKKTYKDRYTEELPLPPTLFDQYRGRPGPRNAKGHYTWLTRMPNNDYSESPPGEFNWKQRRRWMYQQYFTDYLRQVAALDDNIGRLLDYLDRNNLTDNTVVIYTSDNGFFLGDHGWYNKMWMYEESIQIPLIVRWPGSIQAGSTNDKMVLNLDFAPTFADLTGHAVPDQMQGRSLVPMLTGKTPEDWRTAMYYNYHQQFGVPEQEGIRTERYKLIHYPELNEWEAYDLAENPGETNNVYGKPAYKQTIQDLKKKLRTLRDRYLIPESDEEKPG